MQNRIENKKFLQGFRNAILQKHKDTYNHPDKQERNKRICLFLLCYTI